MLTPAGREAIDAAAPGLVALVRQLFFDPLPDELLAPLTAALEHVQVDIDFSIERLRQRCRPSTYVAPPAYGK
jgi:hypothetical protein